MAHRVRPEHRRGFPVHVTLRGRAGLPSLRGERVFPAVREALRAASDGEFRVVQFSVQADHVHLIVEAHDTETLERGARGLVIRTARAINRALGRAGAVWGDRYHARALRTPREVRHGLVYVLMNFRKHRPADRRAYDPCSSAAWFDGFHGSLPTAEGPRPVWEARTWLASVGWRRHGLLQPTEHPGRPQPIRGRARAARKTSAAARTGGAGKTRKGGEGRKGGQGGKGREGGEGGEGGQGRERPRARQADAR